jgi:ubiquinol-cytochrome c reductase iron-sulfur subunit
VKLGRRLVTVIVAFVALFQLARGDGQAEEERIVQDGPPNPRAELAVLALLVLTGLGGALFVVAYALDWSTQALGGILGGALACLAAALIVTALELVVTEELPEPYPEPESAEEQRKVALIVRQSGSRLTRKRLLLAAAGMAGSALGVAFITPAVSMGPVFDTSRLNESPWRRGRRLVDEKGRPLSADAIGSGAFYTAFPEGADRKLISAPVVLVRLDPSALRLPPGREGWAPEGIVAYSKVCTHAGCAIALYRNPLFEPVEPSHALVCPCHYSTFDAADGGTVLFGPAGRPLPQLPLMIDAARDLRAAGDYSGPPGPGWWGVRRRERGT